MALRSVALCNGAFVGIETVYTVIDGKQINIPEKLKELRLKSRNDQLLCPCGCGAHLTLVAGDRNLREQHFRIKDGQYIDNCTVVTEGTTSLESKIVLKCWLDDNLHDENLESRVPICDVSDSSRKYEFTFLSRSHGMAIDYCYNRANLSDEKQSILDENSKGIKIIHIVDFMNGGVDGQYPEGLMKVQGKQGFCLLLFVEDSDYDAAEMKAVFYAQDIDGLWKEVTFADGPLNEYRIAEEGSIFFHGKILSELLEGATKQFQNEVAAEKLRRERAQKQRDEMLRRQKEERELWLEQQRKRQEELAEKQRLQAEEAAKAKAEREEKRRIEEERALEERKRRNEDFRKNIEAGLTQQETPVWDADKNRWIRCEFCGKIATDAEFTTYGGEGHVNLGTCKECSANNPAVEKALGERTQGRRIQYDPLICPECGGKLVEKIGRNGRFIGCSSFPRCRFTRSIGKR